MSQSNAGCISVAIIEDDQDFRQALVALLCGSPGFRCDSVFDSVECFLEHFSSVKADVFLVDIVLPGLSGIEGVRKLRRCRPSTQALMLTVYDDDQRIFDAICAGAAGYLLKLTPPAKLLEAIREVHLGGSPISPAIARRAISMLRRHATHESSHNHLTPHEARVLSLLADGHSTKSAGEELGVTAHAVGFHIRHIYDKLQVHTQAAAVAQAFRLGILK